MIEINLVPDVKQEFIRAQKVRSQVIAGAILVGIASIAIVGVLAFYIFAVQSVRGVLADSAIKSGSEKLMKVEDLSKTLTIQNQLTKISSLNDAKKFDSRVFDMLGTIIPPAPNDIQISDITIDSTTKTITVNGQASNSYAAVEVFKKTISGAKVKYSAKDTSGTQEVALASSISTSNTSYGEDSSGKKVLRFTLSFVYAQELFSPQSKNVAIVITTKGNATDSYLGVPKSIFTDRATDITGGAISMQQKGTAIRKRTQIALANKTMFLWVAGVSVIFGISLVMAIFLTQMLLFNERVLGEKYHTISTLDKNNNNVDELQRQVRILDTNQALIDSKSKPDDQPVQVILDALPSDANSLALGASLQNKLIAGVKGLALNSLQVDPVAGIESLDTSSVVSDVAVVAGGNQNEITFKFSVSGSQQALKGVLVNLERSIRTIDITTLKIENQGKNLTMTVSGRAFYEPAVEVKLKDKVVK